MYYFFYHIWCVSGFIFLVTYKKKFSFQILLCQNMTDNSSLIRKNNTFKNNTIYFIVFPLLLDISKLYSIIAELNIYLYNGWVQQCGARLWCGKKNMTKQLSCLKRRLFNRHALAYVCFVYMWIILEFLFSFKTLWIKSFPSCTQIIINSILKLKSAF